MKNEKEKLYQGNIPVAWYEGYKQYILESYDSRRRPSTIKNFIFKDTFKFEGFSRGRSSVKAEFTNEAKTLSGSMFLSNISDDMQFLCVWFDLVTYYVVQHALLCYRVLQR